MQAKHRKLRRWEVLWAVYDLSSKWRALVKRKEKRLEAYRIAAARLDTLASENPDFEADISSVKASVQSCVEAATEAQTMDVSISKTPPRKPLPLLGVHVLPEEQAGANEPSVETMVCAIGGYL